MFLQCSKNGKCVSFNVKLSIKNVKQIVMYVYWVVDFEENKLFLNVDSGTTLHKSSHNHY